MEYGKLYITATPIGNLKDITLRALEIFKEVDFIICEDTRVTSILMKEYEISKELFSFNAQSEERKIPVVIERLRNGENAALVSDAGTPGISDPGVRLVNAALSVDIEVASIPGGQRSCGSIKYCGTSYGLIPV